VDLAIYQGDDFTLTLTVTDPAGNPLDLSASTIAAQIRAAPGADVAATFTVSVATNVVTLTLPHAQTAALAGSGVWDVQSTDPAGHVLTLAAGVVTVVADVTE
jgi:phage tail sheath gpL-like